MFGADAMFFKVPVARLLASPPSVTRKHRILTSSLLFAINVLFSVAANKFTKAAAVSLLISLFFSYDAHECANQARVLGNLSFE